MQFSSLVQLQPPGHGPVLEMLWHSSELFGVMPSKSACEMVMIFPTPAASMYAVDIDVFDGADSATVYQARLSVKHLQIFTHKKRTDYARVWEFSVGD